MKNIVVNIKKELKEITEELRSLNQYFFENPELGGEEHKAVEKHCELLTKYGFSIQKGYCDIETAFIATYGGIEPGPTIAYLAEYDALPDIGHDLILKQKKADSGTFFPDLNCQTAHNVYLSLLFCPSFVPLLLDLLIVK